MKPDMVWPFQTVRPLLWFSLKAQRLDTYSIPVLGFTASGGKTEIVKALLAHGADSNIRGQFGETPLMVAVCSGGLHPIGHY